MVSWHELRNAGGGETVQTDPKAGVTEEDRSSDLNFSACATCLSWPMSPHLSLNLRQYITGRGVDQESSTGHLGPMCFGTVDDW